jgi:NAD(P)-dependent dehydrogenase (short-subunit alcohol dehydrogenase family)
VARSILIVGNSDGIGAAITTVLAARGDRIVGVSRSPASVHGERVSHVVQDVTSDGYGPLLTQLVAEHNGFDACIYCAGIGSLLKLPDVSRESVVFEVNLVAMVRTLEALLPTWLERRAGHFIALSSLADDFYNREAPSYSASKAAMSNYLLSMGLKVREFGVAMTNVRFGFVDTKMAKAPFKPMMMTREAAAARVIRCLDTRPLQLTTPKLMGAVVHVLRLMQSLRIWAT